MTNVDVNTIYLLIAIVGCLVGLSGWLRNINADSSSEASNAKKMETEINYLSTEVKDLKERVKILQENVRDAIEVGILAKSTAQAAHDRLDDMM